MNGPRRAAGPLLLLGAAAFLASIPFVAATGTYGLKELPWLALGVIFLTTSAYVRSRLPDHPTAQWFAIIGASFALIQALEGVMAMLITRDGSVQLLAVTTLGYHLASVGAVVAVAHLLGLFPDGRIADALHLSESSVEKYSSGIFAKLHLTDEPQVHRRVAAVLAYLQDASRAEPI
jgi:hypothetical protein